MPRGFLMWMEFHPILVGAGCLVVGYVFGRHGKAFSEVQAHLSSSSENRLHAQSQRISHLEELRCCKCCTSVSTELGSAATCNSRGYNLTKRETLVLAILQAVKNCYDLKQLCFIFIKESYPTSRCRGCCEGPECGR